MKIPNCEMCEMCFLSDEEDCMCKSKKFYLQGKADTRAKVIGECIAKLAEYKSKLDPIDWIIVNQCIEYLEQLKEQK